MKKKEPMLSDESRKVLGWAILTTLIVEIMMFVIFPFNLVRLITTTFTVLYSSVWLYADIKHGVNGSRYNRKSIIFDVIFMAVEIAIIAIWITCDIRTDNSIVVNTVGVAVSAATVLLAIIKS